MTEPLNWTELKQTDSVFAMGTQVFIMYSVQKYTGIIKSDKEKF